MTGRSWKVVKPEMQKKLGCDCGHEGMEWMWHAVGCPYRTVTVDSRGSWVGGPAARQAWQEFNAMSSEDDPREEEDVEPIGDKVWTTAQLRSARSKAQGRAKTRLAHEFRMRYRLLYQAELEREGLTVGRHRRVGQPVSKTLAREADTPKLRPAYPQPATDREEDT